MDILLRTVIPSVILLLLIAGCFFGYRHDRRIRSAMTKEEIAQYDEEIKIESQWW